MRHCKCKKCSPEAPGEEATVSIRRYFTVPDGYVRVFIDYEQIELKVLAWFSRDPKLLACYANGQDVHALTAESVTGGDRHVAKQVNFGNSYGMTHLGLAKRIPTYYKDPEGTREYAKVVLARFFEHYAGIPKFRAEFARKARKNRGVFVNPFGRPRRIPLLNSSKSWERERAEREMMSSIISGTAADLMKESMLRCDAILAEQSPESYVAQTIHDELVFDLRATSGWARVLGLLVEAMQDWPMFEEGGVPIRVSVDLSLTTWEEKRRIVLVDGGFRLAA